MTDSPSFPKPSRRAFLGGSAAVAAGAVAGQAAASGPNPLITEVQPWAQVLATVSMRCPMGCPSSTNPTLCAATLNG